MQEEDQVKKQKELVNGKRSRQGAEVDICLLKYNTTMNLIEVKGIEQ